MLRTTRMLLAAVMGVALVATTASAESLTDSLKKGTPDLKFAGPLAFGPDGVLFVGDSTGGAIFAIDTGDSPKEAATGGVKMEKINEKIASLLGTDAKQILINDMAVNPASGNVYFSVSRGTKDGTPAIVRLTRKEKLEDVVLKDVKFSKAALPNASDKSRRESITSIAFLKDKVFVSGLSNEQFASNLRAIPFPFKEADKGASIEIYHGAHGKFETNSPIRVFTPFDINGEMHILAAYQCTPLVKFNVKDLKAGEKVKGTTIAELGNGNRPLDMFTYEKDGKSFILISNSKRGTMKVTTEGIDKAASITEKIQNTAGMKYETIDAIKGVEQLAKLDKGHAVVLIRAGEGVLNLETVPLP